MTYREIYERLKCINKRQLLHRHFEAGLHDKKINIPLIDESNSVELTESGKATIDKNKKEALARVKSRHGNS